MSDVIYTALNGSRAYGIAVGGSDHDWQHIFQRSTRDVLLDGLGGQGRDGRDTRRTSAVGVDDTGHEVGKFLRLSCKGSAFSPEILYTEDYSVLSPVGADIRRCRDAYWSTRYHGVYMGMIKSHSDRVIRMWDVDEVSARKKAAHVHRLSVQGSEFIGSGKMAVRLSPEDAALCLDIRNGALSRSDVLGSGGVLDEARERIESAVKRSVLPAEPRWAEVEELLLDIRGIA